jgi:hypothetical protein
VPRWDNRIHRDDAACVVVRLLGLHPISRPCTWGVDCQPTDQASLLCGLAELLGLAPPPVVELPPPRVNRRCRNAQLLASGFRFLYPGFRKGYQALLAIPDERS